jgi:hypothetical protein
MACRRGNRIIAPGLGMTLLSRFLKVGRKTREPGGLAPLVLKQIKRSGSIQCPLVFVSQISRSGGTWLSQLLDHHPQIWAHPQELRFGKGKERWEWPDLSGVSSPEQAWERLHYAKAAKRFGGGAYGKGSEDEHPMLFSPELQREVFLRISAERAPSTKRGWFDLYFTSFFGAWLDHQRRYGTKRYVSAFASMLALSPENMKRFRNAYPDGWLISVLREPLGWYASVKQRSVERDESKRLLKPHYYGPEAAEAVYLDNIRAIAANRALFGNQFLLLDYGQLVSDTEAIMRNLAKSLGLDWDPYLARQTFNGMAINPNTAFSGDARAERASILSEEDIGRISNGPMMAAYLKEQPR